MLMNQDNASFPKTKLIINNFCLRVRFHKSNVLSL